MCQPYLEECAHIFPHYARTRLASCAPPAGRLKDANEFQSTRTGEPVDYFHFFFALSLSLSCTSVRCWVSAPAHRSHAHAGRNARSHFHCGPWQRAHTHVCRPHLVRGRAYCFKLCYCNQTFVEPRLPVDIIRIIHTHADVAVPHVVCLGARAFRTDSPWRTRAKRTFCATFMLQNVCASVRVCEFFDGQM